MAKRTKSSGLQAFRAPPTEAELIEIASRTLPSESRVHEEPLSQEKSQASASLELPRSLVNLDVKFQLSTSSNPLFGEWKEVKLPGFPREARWMVDWWRLWSEETSRGQPVQTLNPWETELTVGLWQAGPPAAFLAVVAATEVTANRELIGSQPRYALLAQRILASADVVPPPWLLALISEAVSRLEGSAALSLDEAFRFERPNVRTLRASEQSRQLLQPTWMAVLYNRIRGRALDDTLFAEVGEWLKKQSMTSSAGKSTAKRLYKQALEAGFPHVARLSIVRREKPYAKADEK